MSQKIITEASARRRVTEGTLVPRTVVTEGDNRYVALDDPAGQETVHCPVEADALPYWQGIIVTEV